MAAMLIGIRNEVIRCCGAAIVARDDSGVGDNERSKERRHVFLDGTHEMEERWCC